MPYDLADPFFLSQDWDEYERNPTLLNGLALGVDALATLAPVFPAVAGISMRGIEAMLKAEGIGDTFRTITKGSAEGGEAVVNYVRKELPELTGSVREAFAKGEYRLRTFNAGEKIYRTPRLSESINESGKWFSTRRTVTKAGTESTSAITKWGNPVEKLRTYEFTNPATVYYGKVAGGTGYQVLFPNNINLSDILKFADEIGLK